MTSAISSSKGGGLRAFFSGRLFTDNNRRSWPVMLLLFLLIFFSCPVVMLLTLNYTNANSNPSVTIVNEMLSRPLLILMYVYAMIFALISVGVVMGYMHSKRSSYFYGSLPLRRGALFATQYATGVVFFVIPFLVNVLLTLGVIGLFGAMSTLSANVFWGWILKTLAVYMVSFSFAVLASNLSGMKSTSVMVLLLLYFYLPALYYSVLGYISILYRYVDADYLMSSLQAIKLSPVVNTFYILQEKATVSGVVTLLLYIIVPTIIALWLNHKLSYEASENAITFKTFQSTLKYAVITPCAIIGALLFYAMGELNGSRGLYPEMTPSGAAWLAFGAISGGLISYMIINVILNKNFKALFDKFRNFGIFAAIFSLLFVFFAVDLPGLDRYVPPASGVTGVNIRNSYINFTSRNEINYSSSFLSEDITITDKEFIEQVNRISKIMIEYGESGAWKENETGIWSSEIYTFRPVYKLGPLTLPKKMSIPLDLIQEELDRLVTNPNYLKYNFYPLLEDNLEEIAKKVLGEGVYTLYTDNPAAAIYKYTGELQPNTSYNLTAEEVVGLLKIISSDLKDTGILTSGSPTVMQLSINGYNPGGNFYFNIGVTQEFKNTVAYLTEKGILGDRAYADAAKAIDTLTLNAPGGKILVSDKEEIAAILENLSYYTRSEDAVRVTVQVSGDDYDTEIGYIEQDKLPESVKSRLSGV